MTYTAMMLGLLSGALAIRMVARWQAGLEWRTHSALALVTAAASMILSEAA